MRERIAECINLLGEFCGARDLPSLTQEALQEKFGFRQADVMVLFGGSILCGGDVLADAMHRQVARKYVIVGGAGHTTEALRVRVRQEFPAIDTTDLPEADIFAAYLKLRYGLEPDLLERESTNCGNNITYLLDLLREEKVDFDSIILTQDAAMQRRMEAGLRKYLPEVTVVNYAAYRARAVVRDSKLCYESSIHGMWRMERYISLLLGEIPRLTDDRDGYGPKGLGFIAHVDVPAAVREAFEELRAEYADLVRGANPLYASRE